MASLPYFQLDQHDHQSVPFRNFVPVDGQLAAPPMPLFNADAQSHPSFVNVMGVGLGAGEGWGEPRRKRVREQEAMEGSSSQVTSIDFLQTGSVSTGLALSLDDRRVALSSSGESMLGIGLVDEEIEREMRRQEAEMDQFIKIEGERLRQQILEKVQAKQLQTLASVEEKILRKMGEKEAQAVVINQKNAELEEQMKQLSLEVAAWQQRAKYNESIIAALKYNLQQSYAQNRDNNKEGCGDSEVDDTASCCNGGAINFQLLSKENKDAKELMTCKVCRVNEVCMLLLPCRHVCLCKDCESKLSFCPLCRSSKLFGTEIYM